MVDPFTWHFDGYEEENIAYKHTDQNILNLAHFDFGLNLERWAEKLRPVLGPRYLSFLTFRDRSRQAVISIFDSVWSIRLFSVVIVLNHDLLHQACNNDIVWLQNGRLVTTGWHAKIKFRHKKCHTAETDHKVQNRSSCDRRFSQKKIIYGFFFFYKNHQDMEQYERIDKRRYWQFS